MSDKPPTKGASMRNLSELASIIDADCNGKPWYVYAKPYVKAMRSLDTINDAYVADSGESVVLYALSNLTYWRGDTARQVKAELKAHLAGVKR
jgi:hypothetical protein